MPRPITEDELLAALAARYDHASARTVLQEALAAADFAPRPDGGWTPEEVSKMVWCLHQIGQRVQPAAEALMTLVSVASAPVVPEEELDEEDDPAEAVAMLDAELPALIQQVVEAAIASVRERRLAGSTLPSDEEPS